MLIITEDKLYNWMRQSKNKSAFKEKIIGRKSDKKSNKDAKEEKYNLLKSNRDLNLLKSLKNSTNKWKKLLIPHPTSNIKNYNKLSNK